MDTYSQHAHICSKFYDLTLNSKKVSHFIYTHSHSSAATRSLFVGGMFEIAKHLHAKGIDLTVVDYTDEMVAIGREKLPDCKVEKADLRSLPFTDSFDVLFVVGRVFTHMVNNDDLFKALRACRAALRMGGRFFFDNYEDSKIQKTNYFNGIVECREDQTILTRKSSTTNFPIHPMSFAGMRSTLENLKARLFHFPTQLNTEPFLARRSLD
jgi:ubiquinone/menaquinone biosynthesis C-methylase UbiE